MNLLNDPVFRVQTRDGPYTMSLPELLESLGTDAIQDFTGLQRHQDDAFHVFLSSLAAAILARSGDQTPVQSSDYWRHGLLNLAGSAGEDAWRLVVDDLSRPAFMQPPLPSQDHARLSFHAATPDELDLLPSGRNYDLKKARAARPFIDEWIYALISLQTMSGYYGRGNPGITKMNSGFGNRPIVEVVHDLHSGPRWRDAVRRLLVHREEVLTRPFDYDPNGLVLVWTVTWDGDTALPLQHLDPNFVEICRRVRLRETNGNLYAEAVASHGVRVGGRELAGAVGDAWLPIDLGDSRDGGRRQSRKEATEKALTVSPQGLTADLLRCIIFQDGIQLTSLQRPLADRPGAVWLRISVLVRGQGTTEGYHERTLPIPPAQRRRVLGGTTSNDPFPTIAKNAVEYAAKLRNSVLKPAVFIYIQGAPANLRLDRDSINQWWRRLSTRFDSLWSDAYFPWLWSLPDQFDPFHAAKDWARMLAEFGREVLAEAEESMPVRSGRLYKSKVEAERAYWTFYYSDKNFGFVKEREDERSSPA